MEINSGSTSFLNVGKSSGLDYGHINTLMSQGGLLLFGKMENFGEMMSSLQGIETVRQEMSEQRIISRVYDWKVHRMPKLIIMYTRSRRLISAFEANINSIRQKIHIVRDLNSGAKQMLIKEAFLFCFFYRINGVCRLSLTLRKKESLHLAFMEEFDIFSFTKLPQHFEGYELQRDSYWDLSIPASWSQGNHEGRRYRHG